MNTCINNEMLHHLLDNWNHMWTLWEAAIFGNQYEFSQHHQIDNTESVNFNGCLRMNLSFFILVSPQITFFFPPAC